MACGGDLACLVLFLWLQQVTIVAVISLNPFYLQLDSVCPISFLFS